MQEIERSYKLGPTQTIFNINQFVTVRKKGATQKPRSNSKSRSPLRIRNMLKMNEKKDDTNSHYFSNEVKTVSSSDTIYHYHKEQRHMSPSSNLHGNLSSSIRPSDRSSQLTNKYFNDVSLQDSIIYYAQSDSTEDGIIFPPARQYDYNSNLFIRVFSNFVQSCFKIKNLFENSKVNMNA